MTDTLSKNSSERANDARRIEDFLRRKGANNPCPSCNTRSWTLHSDAEQQAETILLRSGWQGTSNIPAYALICNNCGFVRFHAAVAVNEMQE